MKRHNNCESDGQESVISAVSDTQQADVSEPCPSSPSSYSDVDPELHRSDYLNFQQCLICTTRKKDTSYPYCSKCFKERKTFFPERPPGKKRNTQTNLSSQASCSRTKLSKSATKEETGVSSTDESSQSTPKSQTQCNVCMNSAIDAFFVHGATAHAYACYSCSKKVFKKKRKCSFCFKSSKAVARISNL